jgi:hypothetical protein
VPAEVCERYCGGQPQVVHHHLLSLHHGRSRSITRPVHSCLVASCPLTFAPCLYCTTPLHCRCMPPCPTHLGLG